MHAQNNNIKLYGVSQVLEVLLDVVDKQFLMPQRYKIQSTWGAVHLPRMYY